jgi:hypothetical protein
MVIHSVYRMKFAESPLPTDGPCVTVATPGDASVPFPDVEPMRNDVL